MNFVKTLLGKTESENALKLKREAGNEWVVKKGSRVLYMGTKQMCETYMENAM